MRALLSTRLFAARRLEDAPLPLARTEGFPDLELFADPRHFDPLDRGEVSRVHGRLLRQRLHARWLHVGSATLNRLNDERCLAAFLDTSKGLGVEVVCADTRTWGVRQDAGMVQLENLKMGLLEVGIRLVLDLRRVDERIARRLPPDLGLCWDMAGSTAYEGDEGVREVRQMLGGVSRGRLMGVRASRLGDGRRLVPDRHEANLLDEVWSVQAPGVLVYDVDDPSGMGLERELRDTLAELRSFHNGDKRDRPLEGGGIFWASLAPG